jgi:hypothetical protein
MSSGQFFMILPDGNRYGPTDLATLRDWVRQGRVPPTAMLEDADSGVQRAVDSFAELRTARDNPQSGSVESPTPRSRETHSPDASSPPGGSYAEPDAGVRHSESSSPPVDSYSRCSHTQGSGADDDVVAKLIPYRNRSALIGYYLGVFSVVACLPILGILLLPMPIAAIILGWKGLRFARDNPEARGKIHAWVGVVGGIVCLLFDVAINAVMIFGLIMSQS